LRNQSLGALLPSNNTPTETALRQRKGIRPKKKATYRYPIEHEWRAN